MRRDLLASKVFTAAWNTYTLVSAILLLARVNKENDVLRKEFGEQWEAYARKAPYRLIPYIY